jgi:hypothetical protein
MSFMANGTTPSYQTAREIQNIIPLQRLSVVFRERTPFRGAKGDNVTVVDSTFLSSAPRLPLAPNCAEADPAPAA